MDPRAHVFIATGKRKAQAVKEMIEEAYRRALARDRPAVPQ